MIIGIPKETKIHEYRIGLTPSGVAELIMHGHQVLIEQGSGDKIGFIDQQFVEVGATVLNEASEVFAQADMIIKIKEPQPNECNMLRPGQILFTFLHLAADPKQTALLIKSSAYCLAYETVTSNHGGLPLLAPMSEVAGRMSIQAGAHALEKAQGGLGVLLGGVPGVPAANVLIIGGGVAGNQAAKIALGMGANVTIVDTSLVRLRELDALYSGQLTTVYSTENALNELIVKADLVIASVLIPGSAAPKLIKRSHINKMKTGSVIVDIAIDQGGCCETSKPTTHDSPTFLVDGVVHYCVTNMPGAVARTSTLALTHATLPYILKIANKGLKAALMSDSNLCAGLNVARGKITNEAVADVLGYVYVSADKTLQNLD